MNKTPGWLQDIFRLLILLTKLFTRNWLPNFEKKIILEKPNFGQKGVSKKFWHFIHILEQIGQTLILKNHVFSKKLTFFEEI